MARTKTLKAEIRSDRGTLAARRIRQAGKLPAIVYGHRQDPIPITIDAHDIDVELHHGAHLITVDLDGQPIQCLIKEVQYDHLGEKMLHVDLARVDLTERVKVTLGIELRGTPKGLSEGGLLDQPMAGIEIECLATEIPEMLRPTVAHLGVGQSLYVRDLELPPSASPLHSPDEVVATVRLLAAAEVAEVETTEEAAETTAEPEVIRKPKEEQEAGG